jgi:hypothetical protein
MATWLSAVLCHTDDCLVPLTLLHVLAECASNSDIRRNCYPKTSAIDHDEIFTRIMREEGKTSELTLGPTISDDTWWNATFYQRSIIIPWWRRLPVIRREPVLAPSPSPQHPDQAPLSWYWNLYMHEAGADLRSATERIYRPTHTPKWIRPQAWKAAEIKYLWRNKRS